MKIVIRPALSPREEIDVTEPLIAALADELARRCGGNDQLNWLEAERHLRRLVVGGRALGRVSSGDPLRRGERAVGHEHLVAKREAAERGASRA